MLLNRTALTSDRLSAASVSAAGSRGPWTTSSFPEVAESAPMELSALGEHVDHCNGSRSRWFAAQCAADRLAGFMAPRLVTTVVVVALVFGVVSLVA
jgi:hypothetical protein